MTRTIIKKNFLFCCFIICTFLLLLYRISIHADIYDEIINLDISYRVALGEIPFYNCWDSFQSGDILLAPFLWLYLKIVGKTSGIVLYSRFVYVCALLIVAIVIYFIFKNIFSKKAAFLLGYLFCFFQLYGLFYLWYDTFSVIFLTLGCLFTYGGLSKNRYNKILLFCGGIFHGLMAFSYPSFVLLAVFNAVLLFIYLGKFQKDSWKKGIFYIFGGLTVIFLFLIYVCFVIGVSNFLTTLDIILSYRSLSGTGGSFILFDIISSFFCVNKITIVPTMLLILIFFVGMKKKKFEGLIEGLIIIGILLTAIINQVFLPEDMKGLANFMAYLALWAPVMYVLRSQKKEKMDRTIIFFLWLPSILSSICVALLTVYAENGPIKSWQGFILAGIVTIYYMCDYFIQSTQKSFLFSPQFWIGTIICILLVIQYNYIYLNQPYITSSNIRIQEGIYKGIKVNTSMECWVDIQNAINYYTKNKSSILAGNRLRPIYLMTDLIPAVPTTEAPCYFKNGQYHWDMTIKYFETHDIFPEIMFLEPYEIDNPDIQNILEERYELIGEEYIGDYSILVYSYVKSDK